MTKTQTEESKKLAMEYLDIMTKMPKNHLRTVELALFREKLPGAVFDKRSCDPEHCAFRFAASRGDSCGLSSEGDL